MRSQICLTLSTILLLGGMVCTANSQNNKNFGKCPVDYGYQWTRCFGNTKASVDIRRFSDISPIIRERIEKQLRDRVGASFFKRLKFEYGHAEDVDNSDSLKPNQDDRIDGYDMVFQFSDRRQGLSAFHFKVEVDGSGKLFDKTLPLPDIASDSRKGVLISCSQARTIAKQNGFPTDRSSILFVYDWDAEVFTWVVTDSKAVEPDEPFPMGQGTYRKINIEAHTGKVLKIYKETIVV